MSAFPTLPIGSFEHVSMDYSRLREEGLRLLGQLAGQQWTDFNLHDPGITILEQLCYAITDLGYRIDYPMAEHLAGREAGLPSADTILTVDPVTLDDVRKLALDVDGVANAWVEALADPELPFYYHAASRQLRLRPDPAERAALPVRMYGLQQVVLQAGERVTAQQAITSVATRLHTVRALGSDVEITAVTPFVVGVRAEIEVDAVEDPTSLMAEIVERIDAYFAPRPSFIALYDALAKGRTFDELYEGPRVHRGFVEVLPASRRVLYVSDLLHAILDVEAVKAVRTLYVQPSTTVNELWTLPVPAGQIAALAPFWSPESALQELTTHITLYRRGIEMRVDVAELQALLQQRSLARELAPTSQPEAPAPPRHITPHRSLQYQLPAVYGVGPLGLPRSVEPEGHARAAQLATYLLIFDQLLANGFVQLAHAAELLSAEQGATRSYFAEPVQDDRLDIEQLRTESIEDHRQWLEQTIEEPATAHERRKRFLAHLLARFAEELGEHSLIEAPAGSDVAVIEDRRAFLRELAHLSGARGSGHDVLDPDTTGGFEVRLRHKVGLRDSPRIYVIDHLVLRPLPEDNVQLADEGEPEVPLLAEVSSADPWSLQISIVADEQLRAQPHFEQFLEQTILAEAPAHLSVQLHWLGDGDGVDHWRELEQAWPRFRAYYREYRMSRLDGRRVSTELQLKVRDARDRVIGLLGIGATYPLRDVPVLDHIVVTPGTRAKIPLAFSQPGVVYELRLADGKLPTPGNPIKAEGTGGPIELVTPPIELDTGFRILAVKAGREAWLRSLVRVVEGVDTAVVAQITRLPLLDPRIDTTAKPTDARLGPFNVEAEIEVLASQEGVTYQVIQHASDLGDPSKDVVLSQGVVVGTSGTIVLHTKPIAEDVDLRVRGTKATGDPANPVMRTAVLDVVLSLRVMANAGIAAQASPAVVEHGGTSAVRLATTQPSVEYRVYRGRIADREFVFGDLPHRAATIDVSADGRTIRVFRPQHPDRWIDLPGFTAVADPVPGTGGVLQLPIGPPATGDSFLIVQASKRHHTGPLGGTSEELSSAVQLDTALALLVRPDADQRLHIEAIAAGDVFDALLVENGQPGVFYELRTDPDGDPIARPAYFHQRDEVDARLNKGLSQLRVEVDLVVAREPSDDSSPAGTAPVPPLLDVAPPLPAGSTLHVIARKAMSGLTKPLANQAALDAVPAVAVEPAAVAAGGTAKIVIAASNAQDRYWLEQAGERLGEVVAGTGARIELSTGPVAARTDFVVVIARATPAGLEVERHVAIVVEVA